MTRLVFWSLMALCLAVEIWGLVIDNRDVHYIGAIAGCGVIGVSRLLYRAARYEEFAEAGEER
ncbi:hypothetical protein [Streptomyces sp. NBC_00233]|uniref:hypothetical protein n=1 Tax=Streptomyces sp. NBC_00233 TaxID=2975686 RepID=UPI0022550655|nr:hypothetical protein [Streptomyces sp. NBC_00233]MCX5226285.1 hypothetical protein [Streptomyces sp. NBC_00233]